MVDALMADAVLTYTSVSPAKVAALMKMLFGGRTCMGQMNHVLDGVYMGSTWQIRLNSPCSSGMQADAAITVASNGQLSDFYARQHISYSAYMPWQFRLSVCLSVRHTGGSVKNG